LRCWGSVRMVRTCEDLKAIKGDRCICSRNVRDKQSTLGTTKRKPTHRLPLLRLREDGEDLWVPPAPDAFPLVEVVARA
jgi:hypothetical protein